jgi:hypothetical protein
MLKTCFNKSDILIYASIHELILLSVGFKLALHQMEMSSAICVIELHFQMRFIRIAFSVLIDYWSFDRYMLTTQMGSLGFFHLLLRESKPKGS